MVLEELKNYLKENSSLITSIGGILLILNYTGFSVNIIGFYKSLDTESKILLMGLINFIITIIIGVFISNGRISKAKGKK